MTDLKNILKHVEPKQPPNLIVLHGTEPYFQEVVIEKALEKLIPVHEKDFNEHKLFGKDISIGQLMSYARRYPMMADRQLVLVRDAEQMPDIQQKESLTLLEDYIASPLPSTVLLLQFNQTLDERKAWVKAAVKNGIVFNSKPLYDNELPDFIRNYCQENGGYVVDNKASMLLSEFVGNDLKRLSNELSKIFVNIAINQTIDGNIIEKFVGISKEYNVFELQRAFSHRQFSKAYQIVTYFAANTKQHPIQPILINLYNYFSKLLLVKQLGAMTDVALSKEIGVNPFFLKEYRTAAKNYSLVQVMQAIHTVRTTDLMSKGVDSVGDDEALFQHLLLGIMQ